MNLRFSSEPKKGKPLGKQEFLRTTDMKTSQEKTSNQILR